MTGEIEKPTPEDVTSMILSYSDPGLVTSLFNQLGWDPTAEIVETLYIARQKVNLAAKLSAIKYLRQLVRESAEAAGLIGTVSKTVHGKDGSHTTFSARNMATALNPERKQIKIKEIKNVEQRTEETVERTGKKRLQPIKSTSGCDGEEAVDGGSSGKSNERDLAREVQEGIPNRTPTGNTTCGGTNRGRDRGAGVGGSEVGDRDVESRASAGGTIPVEEIFGTFGACGDDSSAAGDRDEYEQPPREGATDNPCVEHRPPTCNRDLYPGVSGTPDGEKSNGDA